jgi:hypothetical protein
LVYREFNEDFFLVEKHINLAGALNASKPIKKP